MPRTARIDTPGLVHHVMVRGIERGRIFHDDRDRVNFTERFDGIVGESGATCYAWALMPNHVHLVLRTGSSPLARIMARLNTGYALHYNRRHGRVGHLFQNRYKSLLVGVEEYLLATLRYVHLNPLRGGLVASLDALAHYRWTGHATLMGHRSARFQAVDAVLERFGESHREARARLSAWMAEDPDPSWDPGTPRSADRPHPGAKPAPASRPRAADGRRSGSMQRHGTLPHESLEADRLDALVRAVCRHFGVNAEQLRGSAKTRPLSDARAAIAHLACGPLRIRGVAVARALVVSEPAVSRAGTRGVAIVAASPFLRALAKSKM